MKRSEEILIGLDEISDFSGVQSGQTVKIFIQAGLPAFLFNGRWYSSKRAIDEYFYRMSISHAKHRKGDEKI
ncbi:hypothetical protein [uncultured Desulfosarcina sp.]|uniref:hypothetical protein n=1 Tax=uncultured Desulfosarcina sp. TaxID=218289 RepID=UPI0029C842C6|nr:hypothetical protein [uncultured Desulfosarcina sp.]